MSNWNLSFHRTSRWRPEQDFARGNCGGAESRLTTATASQCYSARRRCEGSGAGDRRRTIWQRLFTHITPSWRDYTPDGYATRWSARCEQLDPQLVMMPHTYLVRDYAPKLAARFGKSLISDCIRAEGLDGASTTFTRRIFLGKLDADVVSDGDAPVFATFQSGAYRADQARKGSGAPVETMEVEVGEIRMTPEAPFQEVKQAVDLSKAEIIVAIGRGIKGKENIALAEKLAEVLGGDIAASRPICDAEWLTD